MTLQLNFSCFPRAQLINYIDGAFTAPAEESYLPPFRLYNSEADRVDKLCLLSNGDLQNVVPKLPLFAILYHVIRVLRNVQASRLP
jgi:hypothetical protein